MEEETKKSTSLIHRERVHKHDNADPAELAKRNPQLKRCADLYVANGYKSLKSAMLQAGYAATSARNPGQYGINHEMLVSLASIGNAKGAKVSAQKMERKAWQVLHDGLEHNDERVRLATSKVVLEQVRQLDRGEDESVEEVAKAFMLFRRMKRTFLRRGLIMGLRNDRRAMPLLTEMNLSLGKGEDAEYTLQRYESHSRPEEYVEVEIVAQPDPLAGGEWTDDFDSETCPEADPADNQ